MLQDLFDDRAGLEDRYDPHSMPAIGTTERIDLVKAKVSEGLAANSLRLG
jgi:hypothetical protein